MPPSRLLPRTPALAKTFVPSGLARVAPVGPAPVRPRFAPSGAAGDPVASPFTTTFTIVGATPNVNRGTFPGLLSAGMRAADIGMVGVDAPAANTAIVVSPTTAQVPTTSGVQTMPATQVTVTGRLTYQQGNQFTVSQFNRALARAFANSVTWSNVASGRTAPPANDGSGLLAALNAVGATIPGAIYSRGTTTIQPWSPVSAPSTPASPTTAVMTPLATSTPTPPICTVYPTTTFHIRPSPMDASNTGAVSIAAGTPVQIISPPNPAWPVSGSGAAQLKVYWAQAANPGADRATRPYVKGYATLANSTVASCAAALGSPEVQRLATAAITGNVAPPVPTGPSPTYQQVNPTNAPGGVGGLANAPPNQTGIIPGTNLPVGTRPTGPSPTSTTTPATPANIPNSQMTQGQIIPPRLPASTGTSPWVIGGIAALVAVVAGVAYVKRDDIRDAVQSKDDKKKSSAAAKRDE